MKQTQGHVPDPSKGIPLTGGASPRTPAAPNGSHASRKGQQQPASEPHRWLPAAGSADAYANADSPLRAGLRQLSGQRVQCTL